MTEQAQHIQLSLAEVAAHHNQRLFSDYFLDHMLPGEEPWQGAWLLLRDEAAPAMTHLRELYARFVPTANEAQTENDWIKPVLAALGHTFEVQAALKVPDGAQRPDYVFYRDEAARLANKHPLLTDALPRQGAFAVGDAKAWDRSLDQTLRPGAAQRGGDPFTNKNPSFQIFFYMLHSGLPWGILTNGRRWRLYHAQTAHKLDIYYEVDLPALLASNDVEKFLYFYAFFRRAAFDDGPLALARLLTASAEHAQSISESLRQQVYDALRYVAQAFFDYTANQLDPSPYNCKLIYDHSLILLYRLLFIFYAEARDLLPLQDNRRYQRRYSLDAIKKDVRRDLEEADLILHNSSAYWARLRDLFRSINFGSPPLNVTVFNGGLFDPRRHSFLEQYTAGDLNLCRAIDKLARVNQQFVDYRDLAERHLGTIYEGLLEYTLRVAEEPMVELKATSKIVPAPGVAQKDIAASFDTGEVYLSTASGERKLTGSYYTPDYIVKYMVDEALRPALDAAVRGAATDAERIEAVLSINVLDPAMGSGHFPVEATEYIARYLVELGVRPEDTNEADLVYWKRRVAQQCIYGVDVNPLAVELARLSLWLNTAAKDRPLSFLDHHLRPGNALIGSWLSEFAAGQQPGARQRALQEERAAYEAGQLSLLEEEEFRQSMSAALASISAIEHSPGVTIADIKAQEAAYEEMRRQFSEKYLHLANLGTAMYYDLAVPADLWRSLADYTLGKAGDYSDLDRVHIPMGNAAQAASSAQPIGMEAFEAWLDRSDRLARSKGFFHWELDFPDIFFDAQGQPRGESAGFDVIIGNPPYVRQEQLSADKPFFREHYDVYHGVADLFVYFFAQGLRLLRAGGRLAYISSNMWLRTNYATPLRHYLRTRATVETIIDLGNTRVFADAPDLSPSIQVVRKESPQDGHRAQVAVYGRGETISNFREQLPSKLFALSIHDQPDSGWQMTGAAPRALFNKLMAAGKPLGEVVNGRMYRGVLTGLNEAFIINQATHDRLVSANPSCAAILKPMLRGEDLRPWYQENEGRWLVCLPNGWTARTFPDIEAGETAAWAALSARHPALANYLTPFADAARKRQDKGQFWWELRPCDYYDAFDEPKLFYPDIARFPRFSWDTQEQFVNNKGYILPTNDTSLLGVLQSRVNWFCISRLCAPLGERVGLLIYQHFTQFMINLPIPPLGDEQRERVGGLARQLTAAAGERYELRRRMAHRVESDLGNGQAHLNQRLQTWWELPFHEFRAELGKVFKRDIPVKDRDDWETLLRERAAEITQLTDEIIRLEIQLNAEVYAAFGLSDDEIAIIEQETKYGYGEW